MASLDPAAATAQPAGVFAGLLPAAVPELAIKIPVDCALFFVNYLAQKRFVYAKGRAAENK